MGVETALIAAATLFAGNELIAKPAEEARAEARQAARKTEENQKKLMEDARAKQQQEETAAATKRAREDKLANRRNAATNNQGRGGTILTGPLGIPGGSVAAGKTLLGV